MGSYLSPQEVADELDVHLRTVYNWLKDGRLKGTKVGKQWRIRRRDLARLTGERPDDEGVIPIYQDEKPPLRCSFCSRERTDENPLVAGPRSVYICKECVVLCTQVFREKGTISEAELLAPR